MATKTKAELIKLIESLNQLITIGENKIDSLISEKSKLQWTLEDRDAAIKRLEKGLKEQTEYTDNKESDLRLKLAAAEGFREAVRLLSGMLKE